MIEGVILAAGLSSRAGTNKLILKINGKTILERCIKAMNPFCSRIIIVGGHRIEDIKKILVKYPKIELIYNHNYQDGMYSSVKEGFRRSKADRVFLIPGDYPFISRKTYADMLTIDQDIIVPIYQGKKGHPLLIKRQLIRELLQDNICKTLRDFTNKKGITLIKVQDPGILIDIDTKEDYNEIRKAIRTRKNRQYGS